MFKSEQIFWTENWHISDMKSEPLHYIALEIETLVEDVMRLLKRSGLQNNLSPAEMVGYTRRMNRLAEIGNELKELAEYGSPQNCGSGLIT